MKSTLIVLIVTVVAATSCKKESNEPQQPTPTPTVCSVSDNQNLFNGSWYLDTAYLISKVDGSTSFVSALFPYIGENVTVNVGNQSWFTDQQGAKQIIINCEDFNINDANTKLYKVIYLNEFEMLIEHQSATPNFNFDKRYLYKR